MTDFAVDERVRRYILAVEKRIKEDYGEIPDEWSAQLQQLSDLYSCYLEASDKLKVAQIVTTINDGKTECKSAYFTVMLDCINTMKKIIAEFGLSPRAKSMIKQPELQTDDFTEKFLSD